MQKINRHLGRQKKEERENAKELCVQTRETGADEDVSCVLPCREVMQKSRIIFRLLLKTRNHFMLLDINIEAS